MSMWTTPLIGYDCPNHGTKCAGLISAAQNNEVCIAGVAHGSRDHHFFKSLECSYLSELYYILR